MRLITIWIIGNLALLLFGCGEQSIEEMQPESQPEPLTETLNLFTENEWAVIESLSPLPDKPPPNPTNRVADNPDNVALTPPYFHTGEFPTLASVVEFNDVGGTTNEFAGRSAVPVEPLHLSEQEKSDLVEFLETLTGEPPAAHLLIKPKLP